MKIGVHESKYIMVKFDSVDLWESVFDLLWVLYGNQDFTLCVLFIIDCL